GSHSPARRKCGLSMRRCNCGEHVTRDEILAHRHDDRPQSDAPATPAARRRRRLIEVYSSGPALTDDSFEPELAWRGPCRKLPGAPEGPWTSARPFPFPPDPPGGWSSKSISVLCG